MPVPRITRLLQDPEKGRMWVSKQNWGWRGSSLQAQETDLSEPARGGGTPVTRLTSYESWSRPAFTGNAAPKALRAECAFQCLCFLAAGHEGPTGKTQSPALPRWQSSARSHRALCLEP